MSIRLMSAVWSVPLGDSEKLVLLALADCANDDGACWPSMRTLSDKCSKSDRTVQACIKTLVEKGHITRLERAGKGCLYYVHPVVPSGMQGTDPTAFHYTYRITCVETGEFYVGARSTYTQPESDRYMGSGAWVKGALREGLDLEKSVLETFPSRGALAVGEMDLTAKVISDPLCQNKRLANPKNLPPFGGITPEAASPRSGFAPKSAPDTPEAASDKPSRNTNNRKTPERPMPKGWMPVPFGGGTQSRKIVDGWPPGEIETRLEAFAAHHRAKGSKFSDWQAAWSTWVLNSRKFNNDNAIRTTGSTGGDRRSSLAKAIDEGLDWLG